MRVLSLRQPDSSGCAGGQGMRMTFTAPAMQSAARPIGVASVRGLAVISLEYSAGCVSPVFTRPQSQRPGFRCAAEPAAPQQQQQEVQPDSLTACDMSGPHMDCYLMADDIAAGQSFKQAFNNSAPPIIPEDLEGVKLNGIQQFAAAIWDRQRSIPAQGRKNPLERIFDSFDKDRDGHLSPAEVAEALRSRGVDLTEAIAKKFVEASDADNNDTVEREEFAALIIHMASADLRSSQLLEDSSEQQMCEGDCEIIWDTESGEPILPTSPHCQQQ